MGEWFWLIAAVACALVFIGLYIARQEHLSRIRFTDEPHENGPFGR